MAAIVLVIVARPNTVVTDLNAIVPTNHTNLKHLTNSTC